MKNIIKLSIKIGVLAQNDQFTQEEIRIANKFADMFRNTAMTIASFIEVRCNLVKVKLYLSNAGSHVFYELKLLIL